MRTTRAESKERTRAALLEAAKEVFARDGFHGATLDRVAEQAGFTKGAVYGQFASKADLFLEIYEERVAGRTERVRAAAESLTTADEVIEAAARDWERVLRDERSWSAALTEFWVHVGRDDALRERFAAAHRGWRDGLADTIARVSELRDEEAKRMATTIIALGNGLALEGMLGEDVLDLFPFATREMLR